MLKELREELFTLHLLSLFELCILVDPSEHIEHRCMNLPLLLEKLS
jgi:hypothetical protein